MQRPLRNVAEFPRDYPADWITRFVAFEGQEHYHPEKKFTKKYQRKQAQLERDKLLGNAPVRVQVEQNAEESHFDVPNAAMCANCGKEPASSKCYTCHSHASSGVEEKRNQQDIRTTKYCTNCDKVLHGAPDTRQHQREQLPVMKVCSQRNCKNIASYVVGDQPHCTKCSERLNRQQLPTDAVPHCWQCTDAIAVSGCHQCHRLYCKKCAEVIHTSAENREHRIVGIQAEKHHDEFAAKSYFLDDQTAREKTIGVVVPFFNEEAFELRRTLSLLWKQEQLLEGRTGFSLHVLAVMDGWEKASESMRAYAKALFPEDRTKTGEPWSSPRSIRPVIKGKETDCVETFVLQRVSGDHRSVLDININIAVDGDAEREGVTTDEQWLKLTLLIKRDNRRKHNSHDWFFRGFCDFYEPIYAFCTDCGTMFNDDCLYRLVEYMDRQGNENCTAATGRQRVMSREQQGSSGTLIGQWYRTCQRYDYEASLASFMGAFELSGMLPVIPGPCGLYRWSAMRTNAEEDALDFYLNLVAQNPDEAGPVLGNLLLAEDRILSYASVLKTHAKAYNVYLPDAIFYFEAETDPEILLQQRRRWINGTVAGYVWLLFSTNHLWEAKVNIFRKVFVYLLLWMQFMMYAVVSISPGIFVLGLHFSFNSLLDNTTINRYQDLFVGAYFLMYVLFVAVHWQPGPTKLALWIFQIATVVNALVVTLTMLSAIIYLAGVIKALINDPDWNNSVTDERTAWLSVLLMGLPLLLAFLQSPFDSFLCNMIWALPFYYLFLPTMVAYFGAYAFARSWELTWGNRPSENLESLSKGATPSEIQKQKAKQDAAKKNLTQTSAVICWMVVAINFIVVLAVLLLQDNPYYAEALGWLVFSCGGLQMVLSLIWTIFVYYPRIIRGKLCQPKAVLHDDILKPLLVDHDPVKVGGRPQMKIQEMSF